MKTIQLSEREITTMCIFLSHYQEVSPELREEADELIRNVLAQTTNPEKYHELVKFYNAHEKTPGQSPSM